jgi:membrane protease YdiL (CAAX protease family)
MNREYHLTWCRVCKRQQMDLNYGLVCNLTGMPADFQEECPHFEEDPVLKQQQDTRNLQNILFEKTATRGVRFANYLLDSIALLLFSIAFGYLLGVILTFYYPSGTIFLDDISFLENLFLSIFLGVIYFTLFEAITGRTPGKLITGTRVVSVDGSQPEVKTILLRSLFRFVPLEPFSFFGSEPTGWHDRWSRTLVVKHDALPVAWKPQGYYPGIGQSFAIAGLFILMTVIFDPLLHLSTLLGENFSFFLYYIMAVGTTLIVAHRWRKKHTSLSNYGYNLNNMVLLPVLAIATVALQTGIISPIVSMIPVPEILEDIFVEETSSYGLFGLLTLVVAAPILEEMIFRGIIQEGLMRRLKPIGAIVLTSLLFGFIHLNPWQFSTGFFMGLFIGWIYYYTRDILLAIAVHFFNNLFVVLSMWSAGPIKEGRTYTLLDVFTSTIQTYLFIIFSIIVLVITIVYLQNRFRNMQYNNNLSEESENCE